MRFFWIIKWLCLVFLGTRRPYHKKLLDNSPTISLKKMVTHSFLSGSTLRPATRASAICIRVYLLAGSLLCTFVCLNRCICVCAHAYTYMQSCRQPSTLSISCKHNKSHIFRKDQEKTGTGNKGARDPGSERTRCCTTAPSCTKSQRLHVG